MNLYSLPKTDLVVGLWDVAKTMECTEPGACYGTSAVIVTTM